MRDMAVTDAGTHVGQTRDLAGAHAQAQRTPPSHTHKYDNGRTTSVDPHSVGAAVSDCDNGQSCNTPREVDEAILELRELKRVIELDWMPALYLALDNVTFALRGLEG